MKHGSFVGRVLSFALITILAASGCGSTPDLPIVYERNMQFDAQAKMVIVVSFDGLRPDAVAPAEARHIQSLADAGVSAKFAHTILPSLTLPSHSSMLSGVKPETHGIYWNGWEPAKGTIKVTTIFDEAKKAGLKTAMIVGKEKFKHLMHPGMVDQFFFHEGDATIIAEAASTVIREFRPNFIFVHFAHPDVVGHKKGWMSSAQLKTIRRADQGLGRIFKELRSLNLVSSTTVIVTADHGGSGKGHGDASEVSTSIPWYAAGPGISSAGSTFDKPITTYDTAATAAALLGVPVPASWDGKPVFEPGMATRNSSDDSRSTAAM